MRQGCTWRKTPGAAFAVFGRVRNSGQVTKNNDKGVAAESFPAQFAGDWIRA